MLGMKKDQKAEATATAQELRDANRRIIDSTLRLTEVCERHRQHTDPEILTAIAKLQVSIVDFQVILLLARLR